MSLSGGLADNLRRLHDIGVLRFPANLSFVLEEVLLKYFLGVGGDRVLAGNARVTVVLRGEGVDDKIGAFTVGDCLGFIGASCQIHLLKLFLKARSSGVCGRSTFSTWAR